MISSNTTGGTIVRSTGLTAFNSNGFSVGADTTYNSNTDSLVAWQWKKGATPGFDVVGYTGTGVARTVAHSLGVAPKLMIVKNRNQGYDPCVYHASIGNTTFYSLNTATAGTATSGAWNNTSPTSSDFTVGAGGYVNWNGNSFVAYLWAEIPGFSQFGKYTGNSSADGPFIYCGFRPRFIIIKSTGSNWYMYDSARGSLNQVDKVLYSNLTSTEASTAPIDILSNGFKLRTTLLNSTGSDCIYMAFAENPFKYSLGR
jgi:hypothetical protein